MTYFCNEGVFVIIPVADLSEEMLNVMRKYFNISGSVSSNSLRKNNDETKVLLKFKDFNNNVFNSYRWYSYEDIQTELQKSEWVSE